MTVTEVRPVAAGEMESTPESVNLARLRAMRADEAHRADWPEIEQAIRYLTATSVLGA